MVRFQLTSQIAKSRLSLFKAKPLQYVKKASNLLCYSELITMTKQKLLKHTVDPIRTVGRIASFASFGLFVIIVINYVDAHSRYRIELDNQESLAAQEGEQRLRLEQFQAEAERLNFAVAELEKRAILESELASVQDQLLAIAKEHGCLIKKASPRGTMLRNFEDKTKPKQADASPVPNDLSLPKESRFEIHDATLALSIEGDLTPTMAFLEEVKQLPWFASTRQLVLRRDPNRASYLATELELQFSSLHEIQNRSSSDAPPRG